jgi:hypothetical protein
MKKQERYTQKLIFTLPKEKIPVMIDIYNALNKCDMVRQMNVSPYLNNQLDKSLALYADNITESQYNWLNGFAWAVYNQQQFS